MLSTVDALVRGAGRLAVRTVPQLEGPLRRARGLYAHAYVTGVARWHDLRHPAGFDPYELHWVSPERVRYCSEPMTLERFRRVGLVSGGDWDRYGVRFRETDVFRGFRAHFEDGRPWRETEFYDRVLEEVERGLAPWGCESATELDERCERLDALYETIRDDGYRTQRELLAADVEDPTGGRRVAVHSRLLNDEIAVDVARDGELLFADGRNRLAIAILLGLDRVPVMVLRRHERWQATRDELVRRQRRGDPVPRAALGHPDVPVLEDSSSTVYEHGSEPEGVDPLPVEWSEEPGRREEPGRHGDPEQREGPEQREDTALREERRAPGQD